MSPYLDTITGALSAMIEAVKASALEALRDLTGRVESLEALDLEARLEALEAPNLNRLERLEERLEDIESLHLERLEGRLEGRLERLEERLEGQVEGLEGLEERLERLYEAPVISDALTRLKALEEAQDVQAGRLNRYLRRLEGLEERLERLEGGAPSKIYEAPPLDRISNHVDLKTDDPRVLSALESLELFFNMTSFYSEHEGCSLGDYVHHRDILETDYPLDISEPREGEPLLEEARKALEVIKALLIK